MTRSLGAASRGLHQNCAQACLRKDLPRTLFRHHHQRRHTRAAMSREELISLSSGHIQLMPSLLSECLSLLFRPKALLYRYDHTNCCPARKRMPESSPVKTYREPKPGWPFGREGYTRSHANLMFSFQHEPSDHHQRLPHAGRKKLSFPCLIFLYGYTTYTLYGSAFGTCSWRRQGPRPSTTPRKCQEQLQQKKLCKNLHGNGERKG